MKNRILCGAWFVAVVVSLTACMKEGEISVSERERQALDAWIRLNRPELAGNFQQEGGYYVDIEEPGDDAAEPVSDTAQWVRFTFTGRNLGGDIVLTRDETQARQVGSFSSYTHYVPYYRYYSGETFNTQLMEGTYLALRNPLTLGEAYAAERGYPREMRVRFGTRLTLYMPSSVVGSGASGSGGYEGQSGYELRSDMPFVVTMEITDTVRNPLQREGSDVDAFAELNGGLRPVAGAEGISARSDGCRWSNAVDSIPQVYLDRNYAPTDVFDFPEPYRSIYAPYSDRAQLEQNIRDTLLNRFGAYEGVEMAGDTITLDGRVRVWYIGRFLDGFIFDTNIPGVRRLVYGESDPEGEAYEYTPSSGDVIQAWLYSVPTLRYGQWAALLTTSTCAYGSTGRGGQTNTTTTGGSTANDYYNWLSYYNYMNNYYGYGGYYGGYYNNYYGNYLYGMYSDYYNSANYGSSETTTTTTIDTEIPPFTPLLFQLYIEPEEE